MTLSRLWIGEKRESMGRRILYRRERHYLTILEIHLLEFLISM